MTDEEAQAIAERHREATEAFDLYEMTVTGTLVEEDTPALLAERTALLRVVRAVASYPAYQDEDGALTILRTQARALLASKGEDDTANDSEIH